MVDGRLNGGEARAGDRRRGDAVKHAWLWVEASSGMSTMAVARDCGRGEGRAGVSCPHGCVASCGRSSSFCFLKIRSAREGSLRVPRKE